VRGRLWLAALGTALALGGASRAEPVRSEGRGSAPLPGAAGSSPRRVALAAALSDAVERVACALVGGAPSPAAEAALRDALGPDPGRFALSYRSLSEVERTRTDAPGREVVVSIEAQVERARVGDALRRAGLLAAQAAGPPPDAARRVVIEPVPSWPTLEAFRRRLLALGARQAQLERVEPTRAVLVVEGDRSAASLVAAVAASPPPGVSVRSEGQHEGAVRIRLEGEPVKAAPGAASN
jgi:hypothetical protein